MPKNDEVFVGHMLDVANSIAGKTAAITRQAFDADENLRLAVAHLIQTLGEAASRVSQTHREANPNVPWAAIVGMRNKVVHDYLSISTLSGTLPRLTFHGSYRN